MKRLCSLLFLLLTALPAMSQQNQEGGWTVRASAGYLPSVPTAATIVGGVFVAIGVSANKNNNETLDISLPPYFGVEVIRNLNSRWSAGFSTGYCGTVWKVVDKDTRDVHTRSFLTFVPVCAIGRCNYINAAYVKLYGSLEAGVMLGLGDGIGLIPDLQVNPIGVEFGRKFFGLAELGIGFNYTGGRFGVGYRF